MACRQAIKEQRAGYAALTSRMIVVGHGDIAAFAELVTRFNDSADRPSGKGVASASSAAPCSAPCPTLPGS